MRMSGKNFNLLVLFCAFFVAAAGISAAEKIPEKFTKRWQFLPKIVAEINQLPVTRDELIQEIYSRYPQIPPPEASNWQLRGVAKSVLDSMMEKMIVLRRMKASGIVPSRELAKEELVNVIEKIPAGKRADFLCRVSRSNEKDPVKVVDELSRDPQAQYDLAREKWIREVVAPYTEITENSIHNYYDHNKMLFNRPERVTISHILIRPERIEKDMKGKFKEKKPPEFYDKLAKERIENIQSRLKKGESFERIASRESHCPSGEFSKGYLGTFAKGGKVRPELQEAAFSLKAGETSGIVKTKHGYHIIRVDDKFPAEFIPFWKAKDDIKEKLRQDKIKRKFKGILTKEKDFLKVRVLL